MYKVSWFRTLADLQQAGFNNSDVADFLDVNAKTVWEWKMREHEPRFYSGCALREAYIIVMHRDLPPLKI